MTTFLIRVSVAHLPFHGALHLARAPSIGLPCIVENTDDSLIPASFPNDAFFKEMFSHPPRAIAPG